MSERAKKYSEALRNAAEIPVDAGGVHAMELPNYADPEKIKRGQQVFRKNVFSYFIGGFFGLVGILAIPSLLNVLVHTKRSSSDMTAYRRYVQTVYHLLSWYRYELKPGSKSWKSLEDIRKFHFSANKSAKLEKIGLVSQKDMVITQYAVSGYATLSQNKLGFQASREEIEDYCHFWRVVGNLLCIDDRLNICAETLEETVERMEVVRRDFLVPALQFPPKDFEPMTRYIANGMWCFNPRLDYNVLIFSTKRLTGVPDYYYSDDEIPEGYDRSKLELYKLSYYERFNIWAASFITESLLKFSVFRWYYNMEFLFLEFLITYFPVLAVVKFGMKNAFVRNNQKNE